MEFNLTQPPGPHAVLQTTSRHAAALAPLSFRKAPLFAAALAFAFGDCLARPWSHYRPAALLLVAILILFVATLTALHHTLRLVLIPALALWVVLGFLAAEMAPAPPQPSALLADSDVLSRTVTGHVVRIRELAPAPSDSSALDTEASTWEEPTASPTLSFDLAVDSVEHLTPDLSTQHAESGGVRVTVLGGLSADVIRCGDRLRVPLRLRPPEHLGDPGIWQYADYLAGEGINARSSLAAAHLIEPGAITHTRTSSLHCGLYRAQSWAADRLSRLSTTPNATAIPATRFTAVTAKLPNLLRLTPIDTGMLNAMLFGDRTGLNRTLRTSFERTGSFHLFVVSGMHVALLSALVFWLGRRCRLHELAATLITILLASAYAVLTGFGAPVQRALLMAAVFLIARLLSRERNALNAIGAATVAILVAAPASLFEAGLQMTLLAILAIVGIAIPLGEWSFLPYASAARDLGAVWNDRSLPPHLAQLRVMLRLWGDHIARLLTPASTSRSWQIIPRSIRRRIARHSHALPADLLRVLLWLGELLLIGFVAELVMALPMAVYFHRATPYALPANVFSIPLIAVLAPLALITFLFSLVSLWLAVIPAAITALLLHTITAIIDHVSHLHGADWRVAEPPTAAIVTALLLWLVCIWAVRISRRAAWLSAAALPFATLLILWPYPAHVPQNTLEVTAIDVGQGDSLLVVNPDGRTMLIDAGGPTGRAGNSTAASAVTYYDIGEEVVSPYLWSRQIRSLDLVVLTHAHSDHMGGIPAVLRNFHPRELWVGSDPDSTAYQALLAEAASLGIPVRHLHAPDSLAWGAIQLNVLAPAVTYRNPRSPSNDDSLVLHLQYGKASALLEGDAEASSERAMLASGTLAPVTLLKVGHHGSLTSTTEPFLAAVAPRDAVVSVGRQNTFGHPRGEIIGRLADAHTHLYRTDEFGLTQFFLTPDGKITESNPQANPASLW